MINQLKNDLENLEKNNKLTKSKIANLFYHLEEVANTFKNNTVFKNHFAILRIEISEQIFDFLDVKSLLTFRFSSKLGNTLILLLLQKKVNKLQNNKEFFQEKMEQIQKENQTSFSCQEVDYQIEQFWRDSSFLEELTIFDNHELRAIPNPPLVVKILELMGILLDETNCTSRDIMRYVLDNTLVVHLDHFDVTSISDKQLSKLQEIHQINVQPSQIGLKALRAYYQYILDIVKLRESKQIQILSKLKRIEKFVRYLDRQIKSIKKILN